MRKSSLLFPVICVISLACTPKSANDASKLSDDQKASYYIGLSIAENMKNEGFAVDVDLLAQAMREELDSGKLLLPKEEMQSFLQNFSQQQQEKAMKTANLKGEESRKEGAAFLLKNKNNPKVKTTASGLQYEILESGSGSAKPKATDIVSVTYKGTLVDGTVFDSTEKQGGKPMEFPLNNVIKGWTEGVQLMSKGAKYKFYVPSELGYGEMGGGNIIPPGATLIFDIELVDFKSSTTP